MRIEAVAREGIDKNDQSNYEAGQGESKFGFVQVAEVFGVGGPRLKFLGLEVCVFL
jgi:hypothetical protein